MSAILLTTRLVLAFVFALAAATKLADRAGTRRAVVDFGLPAALAPAFALLLPLAELVVAIALVPVATAWWGAAGAFALLFAFTAGIGYNLARGHRPDCHCFGQLHSEPVGWPTLARNGALAALAGFLAWQGPGRVGPSVWGWVGALTTTEAIALASGLLAILGVAVLTWFLTQLFAQQGRLLTRLDAIEARLARGIGPAPAAAPRNGAAAPQGLPVGAPAPAFALPNLEGRQVSLAELLSPRRAVLLFFIDPHCGPCTALLPEAARWVRDHAQAFSLVLVSGGTPKENRKKLAADHGFPHVLLQEKQEVSERYSTLGTPSAVLIRADGRVGSAVARGAEAIKALAARTGEATAAAADSESGTVIGALAPPVKLRDLEGHTVELAQFRGRETLVLFWNPKCGYCQRMLSDLKTWEAKDAAGKPGLWVISTGTAEANREMGLRSPIALDPDFGIARRFGASGTPSAVLVDSEGKVASGVAVGSQAVLGLAEPLEVLQR